MSKDAIVVCKNITKEYDNGLIKALKGIDLTLKRNKIYALTGVSGCGKSTLLNIIGTLDSASSGSVLYNNKSINSFSSMDVFRRDFLGFIFQFHHLIPVLTLQENIESAMLFNKKISKINRIDRAIELLKDFNIYHLKDTRVNKISGGERQRCAIARAFANKPQLILADEPTGNVDSYNSEIILQKMRKYIEQTEATILIATHDPIVSSYSDEIITIKDGK